MKTILFEREDKLVEAATSAADSLRRFVDLLERIEKTVMKRLANEDMEKGHPRG